MACLLVGGVFGVLRNWKQQAGVASLVHQDVLDLMEEVEHGSIEGGGGRLAQSLN